MSDFTGGLLPLNDPNWTAQNEYDPLWPNDYHKIVAGMYLKILLHEAYTRDKL